ncbi:hypothetical protein [Chromobacterium violaceum]|uniref:hypothetical protein n=1 Tax=Chromobacterium violaceum TaxID=536 RepID=UPI001B335DF2|nr:hypothetical protein [Chromobacterium violaceum]MBP4044872.1 hypothetical protein [Chromobacterium violaceum]
MFWGIDIRDWHVTYDDISFLDTSFDPVTQQDYLKEDMLQLEKKDQNLLIDVSWRPSFDPDGRFIIALIKNQNWDKPASLTETRSIYKTKETITRIIENI